MLLSFPWKSVRRVEADRTYTALLGVVRITHLRSLPTFLGYGWSIERQLRRSDGLMAYRTAADVFHLGFYHLSVWTDRAAIQVFVRTPPHLHGMTELTGRLGPVAFKYWTLPPGAALPLHFRDELHRLDSATQ